MNSRTCRTFSFAFLLALAGGLSAQPQSAVEVVQAFVPPQVLDLRSTSYPERSLRNAEEGMVELTFMVDTEGKPFDAVVRNHYGSPEFIEPTLRALDRSTFTPAQRNGQKLVGSTTVRYVFTISDNPLGARTVFVSRYRAFFTALETRDQAAIDAALAELEGVGSRNHYEDAFINLARYNHAALGADSLLQMKYLHGALSFSNSEDDKVYLPKEDVAANRHALLLLQLKNRHFPQALETFALLSASEPEERIAPYAPVIEAVRAAEYDDSEYSIQVQTDSAGTAFIPIYKHRIHFTGNSAGLSELRLYCTSQYLAFPVEADFSYDIPDEWGECSAELVADANATFTLVQR